ncbi:Lpg1974 family pore-forming outer membrane protein [Legionella spiritensis]|uniref:Lpg1974 family pore-forming outer membrane protein n=1 Tax=Legionella spiritensis TaxID=452 RepID=UPI000F71C514|nr:Lpg1974 family pore-forming outer membrane protein [Legionella spiritensis]VEG91138.1 major outer membrane protein [Legionella spiritensis]
MIVSRRIFVTINLTSLLLCYSAMGVTATTPDAKPQNISSKTSIRKEITDSNKTDFYVGLLYIKPYSDNLKYATFVSGTQPYYQSWHYQAIDPDYSPAFELGFNYAVPQTPYGAAVDWIHLDSTDTSFKQASRNTDLSTVEFVAPPYEMSPPVFGIKRVDSKARFEFDGVLVNAVKMVTYGQHLQAKFFGGLNILRLNQRVTTTFSDYAGTPGTPYSYPLPPDPSFSFKTETVSEYLGAGPDVGVNVQYKMDSGFGILGQFSGSLTVGRIKTQDNFTSTSARLTTLGIGTSHQNITAPNATQVVPGADGKLGVFYNYQKPGSPNLTIEAGYRIAAYLNAISTINPGTLVQPGTVIVTPEFSTGTMAIVSTEATSRPFNFNGPYINLKMAMA